MSDKILGFIKQRADCVVATIGPDGEPQAAVVGFSENDRFELMIGTFKGSRKYHNILRDPRVAVVIGTEGEVTVQYEGKARELSGDELIARQKVHFGKIPEVEQYKNNPDQVYLVILPTWLRYTNYYSEPWEIEERSFGHE